MSPNNEAFAVSVCVTVKVEFLRRKRVDQTLLCFSV